MIFLLKEFIKDGMDAIILKSFVTIANIFSNTLPKSKIWSLDVSTKAIKFIEGDTNDKIK